MRHRKHLSRRQELLDDLFLRASRLWEAGKLREARRLLLQVAKRGNLSSQLNVGYMYDCGVGIRRNREQAMYWYKRAYRRGSASAASNIGTIYRNQSDVRRAESWFLKAIRLGDDGGAFQLGKLISPTEPARAMQFLKRAARSKKLDEASVASARQLLSKLKRRPPSHGPAKAGHYARVSGRKRR